MLFETAIIHCLGEGELNRKIVFLALVARENKDDLKTVAKFCAKYFGILLTILVLVFAYVHFRGPDPYITLRPILDEFSVVREGDGVEQAAAYEGEGIHSIIMFTLPHARSLWDTTCLPREWWPTNITEVQLVVLVGHREVVLEVCEYLSGPDIRRIQNCVDVELREAKTGRLIASTTLYGSKPRKCRKWEALGLTRLVGSVVSTDQLRMWLETYVVTDVSVNSGSSASFEVYVSPEYNDLEVGEECSVSIDITGVSYPGIFSYQLILNFNPTYLEATYAEIPNGHFLTPTAGSPNLSIVWPGTIDNTEGIVSFAATLLSSEEGKTGSGVLGTVTFRGKADGTTLLSFEDVIFADPDGQHILESQYVLKNGSVSVNSG